MQLSIREEQPEDVAAIRRLNEQAFGQPQEARLVDLLHRAPPPTHGSACTPNSRPT
jgi:predicted N-acetyltransferase YhbS